MLESNYLFPQIRKTSATWTVASMAAGWIRGFGVESQTCKSSSPLNRDWHRVHHGRNLKVCPWLFCIGHQLSYLYRVFESFENSAAQDYQLAPYRPYSPITQLSPYFTRKLGTYVVPCVKHWPQTVHSAGHGIATAFLTLSAAERWGRKKLKEAASLVTKKVMNSLPWSSLELLFLCQLRIRCVIEL